jgi:6-pyruvoyl-tetrahydropterin synthase
VVEGEEVGLRQPEQDFRSVWVHLAEESDTLANIDHSYGNPTGLSGSSNETYEAFAKNFIDNFAPDILKAYLQQVELWVSKQRWLSKICLSNIIAFLDEWLDS